MVEDDEVIAEFLEKFFDTGEYIFTDVIRPSQALNIIKKRSCDIIILDLSLPEIDGLELCGQLNTLTNTPIIISSAKVILMTKEDVIKKIKEILAKDKSFKGAKIKINFINKK